MREEYTAAGTHEAHRRYYAQFVTERDRIMVRNHPGLDALLASTDYNFNDPDARLAVTASWWAGSPIGPDAAALMKAAGDFASLKSRECIMKEAARQVVDEIKAARALAEKDGGR